MPGRSSPRPCPEPEAAGSLLLEPITREEVTLRAQPSSVQAPEQVVTILRVEYKETGNKPETREEPTKDEKQEKEAIGEKEGVEKDQQFQGEVERGELGPNQVHDIEAVKSQIEQGDIAKPQQREDIQNQHSIREYSKETEENEDEPNEEPMSEMVKVNGQQISETEVEEREIQEKGTISPEAEPEEPRPKAPEPVVNKSVLIVSTIMKEPKYNPNNVPTCIREDEYYYEWLEDILEAFPNKGPPYTPTRLNNTIYIGSLVNSEDINLLKKIGITHVLNCAGTRRFDLEKNPYEKGVGVKEYLMIPAEDFEDYDIVRHFTNAFAFIDRCKKQGGKCLVHCNLGVNRSGAVCAGYLMSDEKKPLLEVITDMKLARQVVLTNRGFRYQLINYGRIKHLLDPITTTTGLPVTIPPPTGLSKFARDSKTQSMKNKGTSDVPPASDFLPAKKTSGAHSAKEILNGSANGIYIPPRPRSACGGLMEPPVSPRSFTRSFSAMGIYRKSAKTRPYSWSDAEIDEYTDGIDPDYDTFDKPSNYTTYASYNIKPSGWSRKSSPTQSRTNRLITQNKELSYGPETPSYSSGGSGRRATAYRRSSTTPLLDIHSSTASFQPPRNMINILKNARGVTESNGLGSSNAYIGSGGSASKPYNTFSLARVGGISFNIPKPPFGTSRRRFGPSKGNNLNY